MRILFHSVKQNDICLMVSDTKLCNNVANYGTNVYYFKENFFPQHFFSLSVIGGAKRCQMHLNASNQPFSSFVENSRVAPYPFTTYLDSPIVPWGHSRAFWNSSRSSLSGKNIQCHRQPEFTKIGFFCCCCPP